MDLRSIRDEYIEEGLDFQNATARTCRDVFLTLVSASRLADHVTVKGGVVMQQISGDRRRATRDIDLDFVRYPMTEEGIRRFIRALCPRDSDVRVDIVGPIGELRHQDYRGRRTTIRITDSLGTSMETKLDLGVHDQLSIEQEMLWFDTALFDDGIALMANSKEQICAEKIRSLLRIGPASTRFKDVFDIYFILCREGVNDSTFVQAMNALVYEAFDMREGNSREVHDRLSYVLNDHRFRHNLARSRNNWLEANVGKVVSGILRCFE